MEKIEKERLASFCCYLRNLKISVSVVKASLNKLGYENDALLSLLSNYESFILIKLVEKQNEFLQFKE